MNKRDFLKLTASTALATQLPLSQGASAQPQQKFSIRWLGAASMEIEIDGMCILTDPCFGEGREAFVMGDPNEMFDLKKGPNIKPHERLTRFPGLSAKGYDTILLSHVHEDHFDQKAKYQIDRSVIMLCASHDTNKLKSEGFKATPLTHGERRTFTTTNGIVNITATPAVHSLNPSFSSILGLGNGYWLEYISAQTRRSVYWAGDTFLTSKISDNLKKYGVPDIFIPHIGNVGATGPLGPLSMNAEQAIDFAKTLKTPVMLPVHHSTYRLYLEPVSALDKAYISASPGFELKIPSEGDTLEL